MKNIIRILTILTIILVLAACSPATNEGVVTSDEPTADLPAEKPTPDSESPANDPKETPISDENGPLRPGSEAANEDGMIVKEANILDAQVLILESFPVQVNVQVMGVLNDGCTSLGPIEVAQNGSTFNVTVYTTRPADRMCTQQVTNFEETVSLDVQDLPAGTYTVNVNGVSNDFNLAMDNALPGVPGEDNGSLSDADLYAILDQGLTHAVVDERIPDFAMLADQEEFILSTENLPKGWTPNLPVALTLMSPEEIQAKADAEKDFLYLRVQEFTAASETQATLSLSSTWAIGKDSDMLYLSGGGFQMLFTKSGDQWQGEVVMEWIS